MELFQGEFVAVLVCCCGMIGCSVDLVQMWIGCSVDLLQCKCAAVWISCTVGWLHELFAI